MHLIVGFREEAHAGVVLLDFVFVLESVFEAFIGEAPVIGDLSFVYFENGDFDLCGHSVKADDFGVAYAGHVKENFEW